ncbi:sulfotransferase [Salinisphaera dokdonensis CL-ES53]|uniref:Sulfotransferase n=1 Tax=Salinisphaera dokdonensis CL-ES53 TaxID=1304272 RepID=A0ABV2B490_9GAMM
MPEAYVTQDIHSTGQAVDAAPILLFGMPRSGTTWAGKLFDSHRNTLYRHEPDTVHRLNDLLSLFPTSSDVSVRHQTAIRRYVDALPGLTEPKICSKLPVFPKAYLSHARFRGLQASITLNKLGERAGLQLPMVGAGRAGARAGAAVVWKSIESLGRLGVLLDALPGARAVHLLRHPCGTIASVRRGEAHGSFTSSTPTSEDWRFYEALLNTPEAQQHGLTLERLSACSPVERMAWSWVIVNEKAMADCAGDSRYLLMRYEDLCDDPREQTQRMLQHCGLELDNQVERFIDRSISGTSGSYYSVFKNPTESAQKWRQEMPAEDVAAVMSVVGSTAPGQLFV